MPKKPIAHRPSRHVCALPVALLLAQAWAFAAEAPVTPGSVQESLSTGKPQLPGTPPQVVLPVQPKPSQHDPRATRFRVNAFDMSGNTVFRKRLLKQLLERFVDMELNLHDLNKAADTITAFYHDRGYTLARAVIPAQKVVNGVVNIHIVEGRVGKVTFKGNKRHSSGFLAARTALIKPGMLVTSDHLENNLLLLNDLPGLSAKVVLEPGAEFGATDAAIKLTEKLFSGSIGISNYGRRETGQNKLELALNVNSPFGWGDQLALSGSNTQHQLIRYWKAGYSLPLNTVGTRLAIGSSKAAYDVSGALALLGIRGEIRTTEIVVSHPFVRSRQENQSLTVSVKRSHLLQDELATRISDNRINVLNLAYQINHIHEDASVTNATFGLATNFKKVKSPTQQDALFARLELDVNHVSPFMQQWDIYLRGNLVHSREMLPDTEKFSLGGPGSVRAYRPSEVRGDRGYLVTAELRRPFTMMGKMGIFRLTADAGEVMIYKTPGVNNDGRYRLHSAGFGTTFYPGNGMTASIDAAIPVGGSRDPLIDRKNHRIWVNVSARF